MEQIIRLLKSEIEVLKSHLAEVHPGSKCYSFLNERCANLEKILDYLKK